MTNHSRYSFLIALLSSVCVFDAETAEAQKPRNSFNTIAPAAAQLRISKVKPVVRSNIVKIAPRPRRDVPQLTRRLPSAHQLDFAKVKASAANRGRSPSNTMTSIARPNVANIVRTPKLKSPRLGRAIPVGNLVTTRNILPNPSGVNQNGPVAGAGIQQHPSLPRPAAPPVDENLADAITVTGGAPDWWKAFEKLSDLKTAGPGNFQPELLPDGRGERPELDPNAFSPDRSGESGERGIGPRGWPGSAQGNSPFKDPSGKVSQGWTRLGSSQGRRDTNGDGIDDAFSSGHTETDGHGNMLEHSQTVYDDGRIERTDVWRNADGTIDMYFYYENSDGDSKTVHVRNGEPVIDVDEIVITAGEDTGEDASEDEGDEKGSDNPEDSQPGADGTARPRGGANDVRCGWWGCTEGGVSTPARTNPGHADNGGSATVGGSIGPGAVTDPTPMDGTTGSGGGGGYDNPAPGGNPGDPDAGTP
jgi:hypothetical protein